MGFGAGWCIVPYAHNVSRRSRSTLDGRLFGRACQPFIVNDQTSKAFSSKCNYSSISLVLSPLIYGAHIINEQGTAHKTIYAAVVH